MLRLTRAALIVCDPVLVDIITPGLRTKVGVGRADRCALYGKSYLRGHVQGRSQNRSAATRPPGWQDRRGHGQADGAGGCQSGGSSSMMESSLCYF